MAYYRLLAAIERLHRVRFIRQVGGAWQLVHESVIRLELLRITIAQVKRRNCIQMTAVVGTFANLLHLVPAYFAPATKQFVLQCR